MFKYINIFLAPYIPMDKSRGITAHSVKEFDIIDLLSSLDLTDIVILTEILKPYGEEEK